MGLKQLPALAHRLRHRRGEGLLYGFLHGGRSIGPWDRNGLGQILQSFANPENQNGGSNRQTLHDNDYRILSLVLFMLSLHVLAVFFAPFKRSQQGPRALILCLVAGMHRSWQVQPDLPSDQ